VHDSPSLRFFHGNSFAPLPEVLFFWVVVSFQGCEKSDPLSLCPFSSCALSREGSLTLQPSSIWILSPPFLRGTPFLGIDIAREHSPPASLFLLPLFCPDPRRHPFSMFKSQRSPPFLLERTMEFARRKPSVHVSGPVPTARLVCQCPSSYSAEPPDFVIAFKMVADPETSLPAGASARWSAASCRRAAE